MSFWGYTPLELLTPEVDESSHKISAELVLCLYIMFEFIYDSDVESTHHHEHYRPSFTWPPGWVLADRTARSM